MQVRPAEILLAEKLYGTEAKECLDSKMFYYLTFPRTGVGRLTKHTDAQHLSGLIRRISRSVLNHPFGLSEIRHIVAGLARRAHVIHRDDWSIEQEEGQKDHVFDRQAGHSTRTSDRIYARWKDSGKDLFRQFSELYQREILGLKDVETKGSIYAIIGNDERPAETENNQKLVADIASLGADMQDIKQQLSQLATYTSHAALPTASINLGSSRVPNDMPGLPPTTGAVAAATEANATDSLGDMAWDGALGFAQDMNHLTSFASPHALSTSIQLKTDMLQPPSPTGTPAASDATGNFALTRSQHPLTSSASAKSQNHHTTTRTRTMGTTPLSQPHRPFPLLSVMTS